MSKYTIVRTDEMPNTIGARNLVSLVYNGDLENGSIVLIGEFINDKREVRVATAPAANTPLCNLALIATPEVGKDHKYYGLNRFINLKGSIIRGYKLTPGNIFSISKEGFDNTENLAINSIVELQAGKTKLIAKTQPTPSVTTIGRIVGIEDGLYVIEVVRTKSTQPSKPAMNNFKNVQNAFTNAGDGETTIKLDGTIPVTEQIVLDNPNAIVTLDLNGQQMTGNIEDSLIRVKQGKLTVKGGGTMKNETNYVFKVGYATDDNQLEPATSGELIIEDGTFTGNCTAVQVTGGTAKITDGDFSIVADSAHDYKYVLNCIDRFYKNGKAKIEVSGGTFHKFNPKDCGAEGANTNFVKTGFTVDEDVDTYTVRSE